MSLVSWTMRARRASKRPAAPEKVKAISKPISAKTAPSRAFSPESEVAVSAARFLVLTRQPISRQMRINTKSAETNNARVSMRENIAAGEARKSNLPLRIGPGLLLASRDHAWRPYLEFEIQGPG